MSGSQHNPNGRQSQLGSGWSPLQLQMANLLARAPQAHMASDRGLTWHTPTPPPHLYHVPAPSPPDPLQMDAMLQAMKTGSNSVFRHTATPPELYRHTPTPPDKHLMRHTPSPGDVKGGAAIPPVDLYPHLGPSRDKLVRAEELLAYARVGVDLSLGSRANGATPPAPAHPASHPAPHAASPALSVRDAPTINSLIARAAPRRVDSLLERLVPSPASPAAPSPHSVIVHSRVAPTPSPPSSNEDSVDSTGAGGSKRKRKPERTVRVGARSSPAPVLASTPAVENGDTLPLHNGPEKPPDPAPHAALPPEPTPAPLPRDPTPPVVVATTPPSPRPNDAANSTRRKTRSGSAETIADIAAMIAAGGAAGPVPSLAAPPLADKLEAVLASPDPADPPPQPPPTVLGTDKDDHRLSETQSTSTGETSTAATSAAAPRRAPAPAATATASVASPSEAAAPAPIGPPAPQASFVEVENQLEKMFAALDDGSTAAAAASSSAGTSAPPPKRRKSAPARPRKGPRKKVDAKPRHKEKEPPTTKDAYDSGSNASSGRSRGPYIQIRGPRESPVSVTVMNAATGEEEESARGGSRRARTGAGERRTGMHASTLGLRYDACTRDATWLCAFCGRGPHADALGDLFGPYPVDTDHDEYRALDEAARRTHAAPAPAAGCEVWVHADCAVWAPGVVARGARVWGLARAVWAAAAARCRHCARAPASLACAARACPMRAHLPCARAHSWRLDEADFRAVCPAHANSI